jgi:protein-S-isoprenylcysteine O-methyltransferase Ste14
VLRLQDGKTTVSVVLVSSFVLSVCLVVQFPSPFASSLSLRFNPLLLRGCFQLRFVVPQSRSSDSEVSDSRTEPRVGSPRGTDGAFDKEPIARTIPPERPVWHSERRQTLGPRRQGASQLESEQPASTSETTGAAGQVLAPGTRSPRRSRVDLATDVAAALIWVALAFVNVLRFAYGTNPLDGGLFLFNTLIAWSFLRRQPALRKGAWWESILAWTGTLAPLVVFRHANRGLPAAGLALQGVAWIGMIAALGSLRRSFGAAPADRGLVTHGPYRLVRHPLYAAELLFYLGYCVANLSWANLACLALLIVIQVIRLLREEKVISGYEGYSRQVRWRLIPWIF